MVGKIRDSVFERDARGVAEAVSRRNASRNISAAVARLLVGLVLGCISAHTSHP